jgi:hypothetical protein
MPRDFRGGDDLLRQLGDFEFVHSVFPLDPTLAPRCGEELRLAFCAAIWGVHSWIPLRSMLFMHNIALQS